MKKNSRLLALVLAAAMALSLLAGNALFRFG